MLYPQHSLLAFPENHAGGALVAPVSREMIGVAGAEHRPAPVAMGGGRQHRFPLPLTDTPRQLEMAWKRLASTS